MSKDNRHRATHERSAAVFDLDGTLLPHTSAEREFIRFALASGELDRVGLATGMASWIARVPMRGIVRNKSHFAGLPRHKLRFLGRTFVDTWLVDRIPNEARQMIDVHRRRGEIVGIVSGAPEDLIASLGKRLQLDFVVGTALEVRHGQLTGRVSRPHNSGRAKVSTACELAGLHRFDLSRSSAYGNAYTDRFLLSRVLRPFAVNPDGRLRRLAETRGWPVLQYGDVG